MPTRDYSALGWTGKSFTPIPTGYLLSSEASSAQSTSETIFGQPYGDLPGSVNNVNYYLARGQSVAPIAGYPFAKEKIQTMPESCTPHQGCFSPPLQFCREKICESDNEKINKNNFHCLSL